jgi:predicted nuclease of predicted toxin-antitoxin system
MKIELFLDEDVHSGLAHALRKRGYDAIHAQELDRKGRSDSDQLLFSIQQKRCLFTFNVKDFVILHNQHAKSRQEHWGIIVSKQLPFRETEEPFGVFVDPLVIPFTCALNRKNKRNRPNNAVR